MNTFKKIIGIAVFGFMAGTGYAQTAAQLKETDAKVKAELIDPALKLAAASKAMPDWAQLKAAISKQYDATTADRTVTKQQIYSSYGKDWALFTAALISYTEKYEDRADDKLMHTNAGYVLQTSKDKTQLQKALGWLQPGLAKEPENAAYRKTAEALEAKIGGM